MDRRHILRLALGAGGSALLAGAIPPASAQDPGDPDDPFELDELFAEREAFGDEPIEWLGEIEFIAPNRSVITMKGVKGSTEVPELTPELIATISSQKYWSLPVADRPATSWPAASRASDYVHLQALRLSSAKFTLTASVLKDLAARNYFDLKADRPVVVFGLRGCSISGGAASNDWAASHSLEVNTPSHIDSNCVLGVWRLADDQITLFRASTVPSVKYMFMSLRTGGYDASILPTGLYSYAAGTHLANKPSIQRGALRISGSYLVLRTAKDMAYDSYSDTCFWTRGSAHNIHAGGPAARFSCAGCQVIPGNYETPGRLRATGEWSKFQRAAGLVDVNGEALQADKKPSFRYMLLTGREAALAAENSAGFRNGYYRLRPGSSGPAVVDAQKRLLQKYKERIPTLSADGDFGMWTGFASLLEKQDTQQQFTTPVIAI